MKSKSIYPPSIIEGINSIIQECLNNNSRSTFRATAVNYLTELFSSSDNDIFPADGYRCIWYNLIKFEKFGEIDWIKAYWALAVSYAQYTLYSYDRDRSQNEYLFKFQEFHHMYCAYLLSCGRYDLLEHLITFSNTIPYSNILVVKTWNDVLDHLIKFDEPLYFETNYSFHLNNGVREGAIGLTWLTFLYSICLVRANSDKALFLPDNINIVRTYKNCLGNILTVFENSSLWRDLNDNRRFLKTFRLQRRDLWEITREVSRYYDECVDKICTLESQQTVSEDKIERFKKEVHHILSKSLETTHFPYSYDIDDGSLTYSDAEVGENTISKDYFTENPGIFYANFPETYASRVYSLLSTIYRSKFLHNSPVRKYLIDYKEIEEAISKLELTKDYCFISMGIGSEVFNSNYLSQFDRYSVQSPKASSIYILKKESLPLLHLKKDIVKIEIDTNEDRRGCSVNGDISYYYPDKTIRYIKLNIGYLSYEGRPSSLSNIEPITRLIV